MKKEDLIGLHFTCGNTLYYFTKHRDDNIIGIGYKNNKNHSNWDLSEAFVKIGKGEFKLTTPKEIYYEIY